MDQFWPFSLLRVWAFSYDHVIDSIDFDFLAISLYV